MKDQSASIHLLAGNSGSLFENKNRIVPRVLPTRLAAKYISKSPNALRIMKSRGLIQEAGQLGNEKYYAISDLERLLRKRR